MHALSKPFRFVEPCSPISTKEVSSGPDWLHEVKFDGYRVQATRFPPTWRSSAATGMTSPRALPTSLRAARPARAVGHPRRGDRRQQCRRHSQIRRVAPADRGSGHAAPVGIRSARTERQGLAARPHREAPSRLDTLLARFDCSAVMMSKSISTSTMSSTRRSPARAYSSSSTAPTSIRGKRSYLCTGTT